jgi:hypothetical protein
MSNIKNTSISYLFNCMIIGLFSIGPFVGYFLKNSLNSGFSYVMLFLCTIGLFLLFADRLYLRIPWYIILLLCFLVYTFISDIVIVNLSIDIKYFYSNLLLGSVLIFLIIENTNISENFFNAIFKLNHIVLFLAFVVIIIQQFSIRTFFVDPEFYHSVLSESYSDSRLSSIYSWFGNVNSIGLCFFPILGLTIAHHLKNNYKGIFYLFFIGAVVAFFSKSRFNMVNYLVLFLLLPIYRGWQIGAFFKYLIVITGAVITLYFGSKAVGLNTDKIVNERILEKQRGGMLSGSAGTRILAFQLFNKLYFEHPIFGKGYFHRSEKGGSKDYELARALRGRSSQIHVGYLSLLYYYGLIGGLIYLLFLISISKETYRVAKKTMQWGPFFAILQFVLTNLTGVVFDLFIMGIVMAMFYHKYYSQTESKLQGDNLVRSGNF